MHTFIFLFLEQIGLTHIWKQIRLTSLNIPIEMSLIHWKILWTVRTFIAMLRIAYFVKKMTTTISYFSLILLADDANLILQLHLYLFIYFFTIRLLLHNNFLLLFLHPPFLQFILLTRVNNTTNHRNKHNSS